MKVVACLNGISIAPLRGDGLATFQNQDAGQGSGTDADSVKTHLCKGAFEAKAEWGLAKRWTGGQTWTREMTCH